MTIYFYQNDLPDDFSYEGKTSVAIDCEAMGLRHLSDRLCLLQFSFGDGEAYLVQFQPGCYEAPNLKKMLEDEGVTKIFHFARFDLAAIECYLNVICYPVYCTKIASKLVRTYTDRHGLKDLCRELLGVDISKNQQTSDWGAQVLSEDQKKYAASDVLYLHKLREKLDAMLVREHRDDLAESCFSFLPTRATLDLMGWDERDIFQH